MSTCVYLMSAVRREPALEERLERLIGDDAGDCAPRYREDAERISAAPAFAPALRQLKALADENRLLAAALLKRRGELCACEIQAATGLTHATVSHHMAVLADAGLVLERRQGKWIYYRLAPRAEARVP
ncbi:MAG TPA: metalloregulator ArsR/SmtB family transcription factor [Thermoplasmata archaeon]|jgi:predicted DNA-binding transcriptional regulator|nr:metalloregulator ArsR/SmtB family transcription factor [Thermoplasmata archaeon]